MTKSKDCNKLGVILGHQTFKDHKEVDELVIYKRNSDGKFDLECHIDFEFHDACDEFEFCHNDSNKLIFFTKTEVFKYIYKNEQREKPLYTYKKHLHEEPHFGIFNKDQTKFVVTTEQDVLYVDMKTG